MGASESATIGEEQKCELDTGPEHNCVEGGSSQISWCFIDLVISARIDCLRF